MTYLWKLFIGILLNCVSVYVLLELVPEITYTGDKVTVFVLAGLVLGILNAIVKPIIKIFSFPLVFLTAGLFLIVINAFILALVVHFMKVIDFRDAILVFPNISSYVIGAIVLGAVNWASNLFFNSK